MTSNRAYWAAKQLVRDQQEKIFAAERLLFKKKLYRIIFRSCLGVLLLAAMLFTYDTELFEGAVQAASAPVETFETSLFDLPDVDNAIVEAIRDGIDVFFPTR